MTLGVYGGGFDPPHIAHVLAATWALSSGEVDRVLVVPTWQSPAGKSLTASFSDRLRMCELAFADLLRVEVSPIEAELGSTSYTMETLSELRRRNPQLHFRLIVGSDVLDTVSTWHRSKDVARLAPLFVVPRSGYPIGSRSESTDEPTWALPAISSSEIRRRIERGAILREFIPARVLDYIEQRGLYRGVRSG